MPADVGVVVVLVACDFAAKVGGQDVLLVDGRELDLGEHETLVVTVKFVDFNGMFSVFHQVAGLLDALAAEGEELACIVEGNLLLPLEAADAVGRGTLDSEIPLVAPGAHTHRMAVAATDVALQDVALVVRQSTVAVIGNEKFALDFFHDGCVLVAKVVKKSKLRGINLVNSPKIYNFTPQI